MISTTICVNCGTGDLVKLAQEEWCPYCGSVMFLRSGTLVPELTKKEAEPDSDETYKGWESAKKEQEIKINTSIKVRNPIVADNLRAADFNSCTGIYRLCIEVGRHTLYLRGSVVCGWLPPGSHQDHDLSALPLYPAGGWSFCDSDGRNSGRVVVQNEGDSYDSPIEIGAFGMESVMITPEMIPEWENALNWSEEIDCGSGSWAYRVKVCEKIKEEILEVLTKELENYEVDCPRPDAKDVYYELNKIPGLEGLPMTLGNYLGAGVVLAWEEDDEYFMECWPKTVNALRIVKERLDFEINAERKMYLEE